MGSKMAATHEDAMLVVQLLRWGTEMGLDDAVAAVDGGWTSIPALASRATLLCHASSFRSGKQ